MKASTPSLIWFFVTSILAIIFKLMDHDMAVVYTKSMIIPSLFIYYLVSNNYKISPFKIVIFLLLFTRDVFNTLKIHESAMGSFLCVLVVYFLLLYIAQKELKHLKFNYKDSVFIFILILVIGIICYSVLNLKLAALTKDIDLIIGGHTHTFLDKPTVVKNLEQKEVLVNQVGCYGINLGRIDFYFDSNKQMQSQGKSIIV